MAKKISYLFIILSVFIFIAPSTAQEKRTDANLRKGAGEEIVTKLGTIKAGMSKAKLYEIFQNQDRIFAHKVLGEEWIVFRNWASDNPKIDVITIYLIDGLVAGWENAFIPFPKNDGSIYEYKPDEKIERWFFPSGNSRWNGADMSMQEWNMLTDTQKVMFFTEYIKELDKESGSHAALDTSQYILALNHCADTCSTAHISITITDEIKKLVEANEAKPDSEPKPQEAVTTQSEKPASGIPSAQ